MEEAKKTSHEEVRNTIAQIYKEMEETLRDLEEAKEKDVPQGEPPSMFDEECTQEDLETAEGEIVEEPSPMQDNTEAQDEMAQVEDAEEESVVTKELEEEDIEKAEEVPLEDEGTTERRAPEEEYVEKPPEPEYPEAEETFHDVLEAAPPEEEDILSGPQDRATCDESDLQAITIETPFPENDEDQEIVSIVKDIKSEIGRVVIGYEDVIEDLLIALLSRGHVLLEGVPGIAKTTLAKTFTAILGMDCNRIQFTPDMLPQDITGHFFYNQRTNEFEFRKGPIFSNLLLADEINRTTPKTQSALLESMEEGQATIEGTTFSLPQPFMVIATINPIEHEGVYRLPIAQADRFMLKINMGYIEKERELELLIMKANGSGVNDVPLRTFDLNILKKAYKNTFADESVIAYINDIVSATRNSEHIAIGASPRAAEHMLYASKAKACISGRDYIIPDDVKAVTYDILNHRLVLSPDIDLDEHSVGEIIYSIIESVKVPLGKR